MKRFFTSYWIRSAFFTFSQRFSLAFFGFINVVILLRALSTEEWGTWSLFFIITGIFEAAKTNLLKNAHIRYVSSSNDENEKRAVAATSFTLNIAITTIFIILLVLFSDWFTNALNAPNELGSMLIAFIPGLLLMVLFSHIETTQQAYLDFKSVFVGYFIRQLSFFLIILVLFLLNIPVTLIELVWYQALSIFLGTLTLYISSRKHLVVSILVERTWMKKITGYGGYIFGSGLLANISATLDQLMISRFIGSGSSVAYYNVASRINGLVDIPTYAAADVLFPKTSYASVNEGKEKVKYLFEKMVAVLLAMNFPLSILVILFAHPIVMLIGGSQYQAAVLILQIYMVTGLFRPFQHQAANLLNSIGKPKLGFYFNTVALMAFLLINYLCLRQFGFYGAAIGTLITNLLGFFGWYIVMKREIQANWTNIIIFGKETYLDMYRKLRTLVFPTHKSVS